MKEKTDNEKTTIELAKDDYSVEDMTEITEEDLEKLQPILRQFIISYAKHKDEMPLDQWLQQEMATSLPEYTEEQITQMSNDIIESMKVQEEKKTSLSAALADGRSKESWLAGEIKTATAAMGAQETAQYVGDLGNALKQANSKLAETFTTKAGLINQNPNLDGFMAEEYLTQSFNLDAAAKGSSLRAEVLVPKPGETYAKNGFDVVLKDGTGKRIHQYQMKFGKTADDTIRMLKNGNYNNQTIVVPEGQVAAVQKAFPNKTIVSKISEGDISSRSLSKAQAKEMQANAQSGTPKELTWNEYNTGVVAKEIAKDVCNNAMIGAAMGAGLYAVEKIANGEEIDGAEAVEVAVTTGADFGVKTAAAGAVQAGAIKVLGKEVLSKNAATAIAFAGVENVKVLGQVASGELTPREGFDKMEETTCSTVGGMMAMGEGAAIGASIGSVLGPVGTAVGGAVGGAVAYIAGSSVGKAVAKGARKVRECAEEVVLSAVEKIGDALNNVASGVGNFVSSLFSWF